MGRGQEPQQCPEARGLVPEAATVFSDERALLLADPDHSDDEDRFILLGLSARPRLLVVCHCYRRRDEWIVVAIKSWLSS